MGMYLIPFVGVGSQKWQNWVRKSRAFMVGAERLIMFSMIRGWKMTVMFGKCCKMPQK